MQRRLRAFAAAVITPAIAVLWAVVAAHAEPTISGPFDPAVDCAGGADAVGVVVATGGDFNGDGINDFAYGAPCSYVNGLANVGRVWIRNGKNGRVLQRAHGAQQGMAFGAAIAFVGDLDGDGKDEVAVGAPYYDPIDPANSTKILRDAGYVRFIKKGTFHPVLQLWGSEVQGRLGASIAGFFDFDGDAAADFVVGSPGATIEGQHRGAAFWYSGATGDVIGAAYGQRRLEDFGLTVQNVGPADADATADVLVTSAKNPAAGDVSNGGAVAVYSGAAPQSKIIDTFGGALEDRLGASSASSGIDGSFVVGSPGELVNQTLVEAGSVSAFLENGTQRFSVTSDEPQEGAQFGAAVAALTDIDGDGIVDYAASAPFHDVTAAAPAGLLADAGRVSVLSGKDGHLLMTLDGERRAMRMGRSLAGGVDLDDDGIGDIVSGNSADSPMCRRSAGSVQVFSGANGNMIRTFRGSRGFQTRIFAALQGKTSTVRSYLSDGTLRGVDASVFSGIKAGELSVAVMDERQRPRVPGSMRVAVGTGHGAQSPSISILLARQKNTILESFDGFDSATYDGGVNLAAGDLDDDGDDELVIAQADSADGNVFVNIFRSLSSTPPYTGGWLQIGSFQAFKQTDAVGQTPINANGANVAVVSLPGTSQRGIAVAPVAGVPVVRIFDALGQQLYPVWLAYDTANFSGVNLAVVDLAGDGKGELVTAPRSGVALIRAFEVDGTPYAPGAEETSFQILPSSFVGGATVAGADVDCDGAQEILAAAGPGAPSKIGAFETDGQPVAGFTPFAPFDTSKFVALAGTDRFLRK